MNKVFPTKLKNGHVVSGRLSIVDGQPTIIPYGFTNRAQAAEHARKVGGVMWCDRRPLGVPFYVRLDHEKI